MRRSSRSAIVRRRAAYLLSKAPLRNNSVPPSTNLNQRGVSRKSLLDSSVAYVVQHSDSYRGCQAINTEQIPAVAFEPLAEPFERQETGDKRAYHADEACH